MRLRGLWRPGALAVVLSAIAAGTTLAGGEPGKAAFPGQNGRIAFVGTENGNDDIYTIAADGTNLVRLTNNPAHDTQPAWSPDGQQLLITSDRPDGKERIYSIPAGGGNPERKTLLSGDPQESSPAFGPDGRITWETTLHGGYEIYAQGMDGQPRRLTNNDPISDRAPAWSPDGTKIAFWSARGGAVSGRDIFVMNADGSNQQQLTTYFESDRDPVWSPDGTKIVFERTLPGGNSDLFVMNANGSNQVNVTNNPSDDRNAAWSPDGTKITFRSSRDGDAEIYVMDADGQNVMPLTADEISEDDPDWQPAPDDRDGDALLDEWETKGYNPDGKPPIEVDLPKMGADPMRKDVFVEIDSMRDHQLSAAALKKVIDAFAAAPASPTPLGLKPGIVLHIDNGPDSVMDPTTGERWGKLSKSESNLPHSAVLGTSQNGAYSWAAFDRLKKAHFAQGRRRVFHYLISAHRVGDTTAKEPILGLSREDPASDMVLGLAAGCPVGLDCAGTLEGQAGAFMHELGHNLGLGDGGLDSITLKPNHISVMNYLYAGGIGYQGDLRFDYSRFAGSLDESSLDEAAGLGLSSAVNAARFDLMLFCKKGSVFQLERLRLQGGGADWNCNGRIDSDAVRASLNSDERFETLRSADEWSSLQFGGGAIGAKLVTVLPSTTPATDVPRSQLVASARVLLGDRKVPTVQIAGLRRARGPVRLIVTARDDKGLSLVAVTIDGRSYQLAVGRKGQKVFRAAATVVRRGNRVVRAGAVDRAGNRSQTVVARVRVR